MGEEYNRGFEDAVETITDFIASEMNFFFYNGEYDRGAIIENLMSSLQEFLDNNAPHL